MNEAETPLHLRGMRVFLCDAIEGEQKIRVRGDVPMTEARRKSINDWLLESFGRHARPIYKVGKGETFRDYAPGRGDRLFIRGPALVMHPETWREVQIAETVKAVVLEAMERRLGGTGWLDGGINMGRILGGFDLD